MKKSKTLKDLQNHPLVELVVREDEPYNFYYDWQTRTEKESQYQYWLYLKVGYWFECDEVTSLAEPTAKLLIEAFNDKQITLDPRDEWKLVEQV
tara:strand:+ start:314 stop:595 length:282 start_codon:yes stop_codon:yes gene_type:complete